MTYCGGNRKSVRQNTRTIMLIISLILLLLAAVNGSIALLMDSTSKVENAFTPAEVTVEIKEKFEDNKKIDVYVHNTSNIKAYVRVTLAEHWERTDGEVTKIVPKPATTVVDINWGPWKDGNSNPDWFEVDGIYYYTKPLETNKINDSRDGDDTTNLIDSVTVTLPDGYTYHLEILAEAIQAEPAAAVEDAWKNVNVSDEGLLIANTVSTVVTTD